VITILAADISYADFRALESFGSESMIEMVLVD